MDKKLHGPQPENISRFRKLHVMQDTVRQPYHEDTINTGLRLEVEGAASDFWPQQLRVSRI